MLDIINRLIRAKITIIHTEKVLTASLMPFITSTRSLLFSTSSTPSIAASLLQVVSTREISSSLTANASGIRSSGRPSKDFKSSWSRPDL